jgi:SET domain
MMRAAKELPRETISATLDQSHRLQPAFETRTTKLGRGIFACCSISAGMPLFEEDDWADEAERRIFTTLSAAQFNNLSPPMRTLFLRFAYNSAPDEITGTFQPEEVRHPANFINHSCEPNAGYNGGKAIVTLRRISAGEEIRMDYGTFSFSFDHNFNCACGTWGCRGTVRRDDWRALVRTGLRLPGFMRALADRALWG